MKIYKTISGNSVKIFLYSNLLKLVGLAICLSLIHCKQPTTSLPASINTSSNTITWYCNQSDLGKCLNNKINCGINGFLNNTLDPGGSCLSQVCNLVQNPVNPYDSVCIESQVLECIKAPDFDCAYADSCATSACNPYQTTVSTSATVNIQQNAQGNITCSQEDIQNCAKPGADSSACINISCGSAAQGGTLITCSYSGLLDCLTNGGSGGCATTAKYCKPK